MHDEMHKTVSALDKAVFGDRNDPKEYPGLIAEVARMGDEQKRTNQILMEVKNSLGWIVKLILGGFVTALLTVVMKTNVY